jgi:hypothetical protein
MIVCVKLYVYLTGLVLSIQNENLYAIQLQYIILQIECSSNHSPDLDDENCAATLCNSNDRNILTTSSNSNSKNVTLINLNQVRLEMRPQQNSVLNCLAKPKSTLGGSFW